MTPQTIHVQFDSTGRATHVIIGGPAPATFARYRLCNGKWRNRVQTFMATMILMAVIACQPIPNPDPTPEPDGGVELVCESPADCACARLCSLDCSECDYGQERCTAVLEKVMLDRIMVFSPECVSDAVTVEAIRACPGVVCE